jgi:hypothetical protein
MFREDVIRFLISKNPDARTKSPEYGQIPLHCFCETTRFEVSEETLDKMLLNCPETLWTKRSDDNMNALYDNMNALKISLTASHVSLTSMLRKQIVHHAREFKSTTSHENFLHLFRGNCFDHPTL